MALGPLSDSVQLLFSNPSSVCLLIALSLRTPLSLLSLSFGGSHARSGPFTTLCPPCALPGPVFTWPAPSVTLAERHRQIPLLSLTFLLSSSDPPWAHLHLLYPLLLSSCPMVHFVTLSVCHFLGGLSTPLSSSYFCFPQRAPRHPEWMHLCVDLLPSCGHSPCPCLFVSRSLSLLSLLGFPP